MPGLNARVDLVGLGAVERKFRAAPKQVQKEAVDEVRQAARPMLTEMRGEAFTRMQRRAMDSVVVQKDDLGIELRGGSGATLGATLFMGAEFGGRRRKPLTYLTHSPLGTPYSVRRRTTMQFLPHLGQLGYFFWPTVRDWYPKINKAVRERVEKVMS